VADGKHGFKSGSRTWTRVTCLPASGCGPLQPPKSYQTSSRRRSCMGQRHLPLAPHIAKVVSAMTCGSVKCQDVRVGMILEHW